MLKSRLIWQKDVRCRKRWELSCFKVRQNHRPGSETGQRQGKQAERMTPACRAVGGGHSGGQSNMYSVYTQGQEWNRHFLWS